MSSELESAGDGFWLFDGLEEEPYGILPLINLSGKNNATSTKYVDRIGSYQWDLSKDEPVILVKFLHLKKKIIFLFYFNLDTWYASRIYILAWRSLSTRSWSTCLRRKSFKSILNYINQTKFY